MKTILLLQSLLLFPVLTYTQSTFLKTYPAGYIGLSVQETTDHGYIISGESANSQAFLLKTNSLGDTLWSRTINYTPMCEGAATFVRQTTDGGYIVSGSYSSSSTWGLIYKSDSLGDEQWSNLNLDRLDCVQPTFENQFVCVSGGSLIFFNEQGDIVLIKFFSYVNGNHLRHFIQTSDSGFAFCTNDQTDIGRGLDRYNVHIKRMNPQGDSLWNYISDSPYSHEGLCIQQTNDQGYIICGYTILTGGSKVLLLKLDKDGNFEWSKAIGDNSSGGNFVKQTADHGYIICGNKGISSHPDMILIKTDSAGNVEWQRIFDNSPNWEYAIGLDITYDSCFVICGHINGKMALIKTNSQGLIVGTENFNSPDLSLTISPNPNNGVFTIKTGYELISYEIYNASGVLLRSEDVKYLKIKSLPVNISSFGNGLRCILVHTTQGIGFRKILIE